MSKNFRGLSRSSSKCRNDIKNSPCNARLLRTSSNTVCPTRYRTQHFFNNFTTNEDIATKFEADYRHIPLHFSHNERTCVQISLQYSNWC